MSDKDTHLLAEAYGNIHKPQTITVNVPDEFLDYLSNSPETGMGYQKADVLFDDGTIKHNCTILNGESIELPDIFRNKKIKRIKVL